MVVLGSDGEVYTMGGATDYGDPVNTNHLTITCTTVEIVTTLDGKGYYILATDGGVFCYPDAQPGYYKSDAKDYPHSLSVPGLLADGVISTNPFAKGIISVGLGVTS